MKAGYALDLFLTGVILYPKPKIRFGLWKVKSLKCEIEDAVNAGANHVEFNGDVIQFTPDFREKFRKEMEQLIDYLKELKKNGVTFSIHIEHVAFCFPARFRQIRDGTIDHFKYLVDYYSPLNPTHYTLHLGPDEIFAGRAFKDSPSPKIPSLKNLFKRFKIAKKVGVRAITIEEILRVAPKAFGRLGKVVDLKKVYIENSEGMTREEFDELFKPISKKIPELGCIFDVGHVLVEEYLRNKNCVEDFIDYWGRKKGKIKAVHCHDVVLEPPPIKKDLDLLVEIVRDLEQRKDETLKPDIEKLREVIKSAESFPGSFADHQPLGTGILNLPSLMKALKDADFHGPIIFEPKSSKGAKDSIRLLAKEIEKIKKSK